MSSSNRFSSIALVVLVAAACDRTASEGVPRRASTEPSVAADASEPARPTSSPAAADVEALRTLAPRTTRAGTLRFSGPALRHPDAAAIVLARLQDGGESSEIRAALAEALARTPGPYASAASALLSTESDATVRAAIVAALGRTDDAEAIAGIRAGLGDRDAGVRAEAARSAASHPAGATLRPELRALLGDDDEAAMIAAIRAIGALRTSDLDTNTALAGLLDDARADVRLHALRALGRVDAEFARARPELATLRSDADPRVAKLAQELAQAP